jgi:hypothetical protein
MEITGDGILVMDGDGTLVLDGTVGTATIGVGIIGTETIGAGITGMEIIGDTQITTTIELIPITQAEEAPPTPTTPAVIEITVLEIQQIIQETKAIRLAEDLIIQITEEIPILISEEILQTDSIEQVQHFQEIKDNHETILITIQAEDQTRIVPAAKTTLLPDLTLQVQETIIIPDHTVLVQIVPDQTVLEILVVDHPVAEEVAEDNNSFYTFLF